ncbi:DNA/RNA nuclease SfsA [Thermosipho melanesiensis]|nr:DNA/RNA nuclease SfsA [Thermosipho melanesiensis]
MNIIKIDNTQSGIFLERINKYLAKIYLNENVVDVHVHDPGRLKELLFKNNKVLVKKVNSTNRKTKYDLIAAKKEKEYVLVHSMYHRYIAEKILRKKYTHLKAEVKYKNSRIDFLAEDKFWIEIKGCTLSDGNMARFPDAPTKRGTKHLEDLMELKKQGFDTFIYFLIFANANYFSPNYETDLSFSKKLEEAYSLGVKIVPLLFSLENNWIVFKREIQLIFDG